MGNDSSQPLSSSPPGRPNVQPPSENNNLGTCAKTDLPTAELLGKPSVVKVIEPPAQSPKTNGDKLLSSRDLFFRSGAGCMTVSPSDNNIINSVNFEGKSIQFGDGNTSQDPNNIVKHSNNSVKSDSDRLENNVNSDDREPANETKEEKSVTDGVGDYVLDLAKTGPVASREEYSSGNSPGVAAADVIGESSSDMQRVGPYCLEANEGLMRCDGGYEGLKGETLFKGPLSKSVNEKDLFICREEEEDPSGNNESSETSEEDESSESESDSENVVKNDSGFWDERDSGLFSSDSQATAAASLSSVSSILFHGGRYPREKKHVKWADIDGNSDLTRSKENIQPEESTSEEEESEEDDDEKEVECAVEKGEEESSETEEESSESDEEEKRGEPEEVKPTLQLEYKREDTWLDSKSSSSEDSSEDEEEKDERHEPLLSEVNEERTNAIVPNKNEESEISETESEDEETSEEEVSEEEIVKDDHKPINIDVIEMQKRIAELQKDIDTKTSNIDRLQIELDSACSESEKVRKRFQKLEEDLELHRQTNKELTEKLQITEHLEEEKISRSYRQLNDAEKRIRELESELERIKSEYNNLQVSFKKLQADRDMEVQIIQKALEKALTDQEEMEVRYEKEFENLRTLNSGREVQMLEDFEWKLREVERNCKKKIQDYETEFEQKTVLLANQLASAQADLDQISHLKLCEIELNQLKQTSSEQRKNLRLVNRKLEELQVSEKILQEEVNSLRSSLDKEKAHIVALQTMHKEELDEKDRKLKVKLEIQISQLTQEWEERLRKECYKIKTDTERNAREERIAAIDLAHKVKEQEISQLKKSWEKKSDDFKNEIERYKKKITEIENQHRSDLDNAQTNSDQEVFNLRRKMDKLDMSYQEKIEKIQEQHEAELANLKEDSEKRIQQSESALQMQLGNSRTTLELVKQQLRNEAQSRIEKLENEYQFKLEQQRISIQREKETALTHLEEKHKLSLDEIYKEIEKTKKQARNEHEQNLAKRRNQPTPSQVLRVNTPQNNIKGQDDNNCSQSLISSRLDVAEVAEEIRTQGKEEVLQKSIEQLTKQLNAGKMEIEKLRQQLEAREIRQQQNNQQPQGQQQRNNIQHPVPNPRRNRKGRSGRN